MCWGKQAFFRVVLPLMLLNTSFLPLGCFSLLGELKMRNGDGISGGAKLAAWSALIAAHTPPLLCCSLSLLTFQAWRGVEIADLSNGKMNAWWSVKLKISACMTARPDTSVIRKKNDGVRCIIEQKQFTLSHNDPAFKLKISPGRNWIHKVWFMEDTSPGGCLGHRLIVCLESYSVLLSGKSLTT